MRNPDVPVIAVLLLGGFLLSSCATTNAPARWLPGPDESLAHPTGGWIEVNARGEKTWGELIALSEDTVFVADLSLHAIPRSDILSARLVTYDAPGLAGYVILGTLTTISNGVFLIFTAPMWLIGGSIAAGSRSYEPIIDHPDEPLSRFLPYARYPQGLPETLDRRSIIKKTMR